MDPTTLTYTLVALTAIVFAFLLSQPTSFAKWVQKKKYQYEVTFALYMLTPTEKFIFNSVLFLFLSMVLIACSLYLPTHVTTMARRAFYYYAGDGHLGDGPQQQQKSPLADGLVSAATRATEGLLEATQGPAAGT